MGVRSTEEAAVAVVRRLVQRGHVAYLAGGCVRDRLLGRRPKDFDVATDATPRRVVECFSRTREVGVQFGVVLVKQGRFWVEVATFRADLSYSDGRHPDAVVFGSAEEDAKRRDFTVNGMFLDPLTDRVIDFVGGQADLQRRIIRAIGEPAQRFQEDHLRMLRAVRLAAEIGFEIDADTLEAIRRLAPLVRKVSAERIREELAKLLAADGRGAGLRRLWETGLLPHLWPGGQWTDERVARTVSLLDRLPPSAGFELGLAGLLITNPMAELRSVCRALACSNATVRKVTWLRANLERLQQPEPLELAELKRMMAGPGFADMILLWRAYRLVHGLPADVCDELSARAERVPPDRVRPRSLITGEDLIRSGYSPGPKFKRVLERVYYQQLNEELGDREAALSLARQLLAD